MANRLPASPWTRAPLLAARQPAVALAVAVTVALLGLATASYPLYLASSASGALALQVTQRCPDGLDASVVGSGPVRGVPAATDSLDRRLRAALASAGASPGDLQSPIVTLNATGIGARVAGHPSANQDIVQIREQDRVARQHNRPVVGRRLGGLALPGPGEHPRREGGQRGLLRP